MFSDFFKRELIIRNFETKRFKFELHVKTKNYKLPSSLVFVKGKRVQNCKHKNGKRDVLPACKINH